MAPQGFSQVQYSHRICWRICLNEGPPNGSFLKYSTDVCSSQKTAAPQAAQSVAISPITDSIHRINLISALLFLCVIPATHSLHSLCGQSRNSWYSLSFRLPSFPHHTVYSLIEGISNIKRIVPFCDFAYCFVVWFCATHHLTATKKWRFRTKGRWFLLFLVQAFVHSFWIRATKKI